MHTGHVYMQNAKQHALRLRQDVFKVMDGATIYNYNVDYIDQTIIT